MGMATYAVALHALQDGMRAKWESGAYRRSLGIIGEGANGL
eukprot:CAMPEP_0119424734 /NCGR_PEP_ID=MMETSP1335-20130426/33162_1 /TAXON_ID=259385 /ORGANISM="Chrysoculter rhomboideus, Strain RCC1486" /LENGTH=40 /DNA_ID= /DNA_START= /DNA_END= /DNA_ORIENTATION=